MKPLSGTGEPSRVSGRVWGARSTRPHMRLGSPLLPESKFLLNLRSDQRTGSVKPGRAFHYNVAEMKIIVIQVDGLQLAALGAYGNVWVDTPNLDCLAASSVVFDQHFAVVPSAEGVAHAMFGGRHAMASMENDHEVRRGQSVFELLLSQNVICFASHQGRQRSSPPKAEVATSATECSVLDTENFQHCLRQQDAFGNSVVWFQTHLMPPWDAPPERFAKQCEDWELEVEPQAWLDPAPGWLDRADDVSFARLQRTYAAVVEVLDETIGEWLDLLSQQSWWAQAMLIFTAGHGQNLGEHGLIGEFRPWLHEELVHVPLMIRLPNDAEAGRRVLVLTQTVDIPATILDCFDIARPEEWHGSSLLRLCRGGPAIRNFACMGLQIGGASECAMRTADAAVILPQKLLPEDPPRGPMFFIKPDDRWEVNDLRQPNLDEAEKLEQLLRDELSARGLAGKSASGQLD
jgi:hypothetical protein